jgi:hypothetical protein
MNKKSIMHSLFLCALMVAPVSAFSVCTLDDAVGFWSSKYHLPNPDQYGACDIQVYTYPDLAYALVSGYCYNKTFDFDTDILSGQVYVKDNCRIKGRVRFSNGQTGAFSGKIKRHGAAISTRMSVNGNGYSGTGKMKMKRVQ